MQTLSAACSKAEPKIFVLPQTPFLGTGWPKFNQLEIVTTFTYRSSLVKIDARNFKLSWSQTHKQSHKPTDRTDLQYTAPLSLACSVITVAVAAATNTTPTKMYH